MAITAVTFTLCVAILYTKISIIAVAPLMMGGLLFFTLPLMLSKRSDEPLVGWQPIVVLCLLLAWARLPSL